MKTPTIIVLPKNYLFSKGLKMMMIYKTCWGEHLSYFYNYIMCDIYECEFKLVGRKMANLNERGEYLLLKLTPPPPGSPLIQVVSSKNCEHSFDHFSSVKIRLREEKRIFLNTKLLNEQSWATTFVDDNHNHWNYTSGQLFSNHSSDEHSFCFDDDVITSWLIILSEPLTWLSNTKV